MCSDILILNLTYIDPKILTGSVTPHAVDASQAYICGQRSLCQRHDAKTIQNLYISHIVPSPFLV